VEPEVRPTYQKETFTSRKRPIKETYIPTKNLLKTATSYQERNPWNAHQYQRQTCIPKKRPAKETYIPKKELQKKRCKRDLYIQNRCAKETYAQDICHCESYLRIHAYPQRDLGTRPTYPK